MRLPNVFRRFTAFARKSLTIIRDNFIPIEAVRSSVTARIDTQGLSSNVVMAPVFWIMRNITEAEFVVERKGERGLWTKALDHDGAALVERPNTVYDGDAMWKATVLSYVLAGEAYWRKVRNAFGEVIQLWYVPHWCMEPKSSADRTELIQYYEYRTGSGAPIPMAPRDVVHFRFGLDPEDMRHGFPPLRPLLREVMTDDQASQFSETILRNMGIPGLIVSPKAEGFKPDQGEVDKLRNYFETAFSGERRGKPFVMKIPTDVQQFGFDPNKLMLSNLRDISEERVCATLGIPSAVVGFGSGLQSTKVGATMRELRRLASVQCVIPMQNSLACQATQQLLGDFVGQPRRFRYAFDASTVSAFPEDDAIRTNRIRNLVDGDIMTMAQAQEALGLEVDPGMDIYRSEYLAKLKVENETAPPNADPAPDETSADDVADDAADADETDETKQLRAIRNRWLTANGNGRHL